YLLRQSQIPTNIQPLIRSHSRQNNLNIIPYYPWHSLNTIRIRRRNKLLWLLWLLLSRSLWVFCRTCPVYSHFPTFEDFSVFTECSRCCFTILECYEAVTFCSTACGVHYDSCIRDGIFCILKGF